MNVFNRVMLIVLLAGVTALAIAVIILAWVAPESSADALDEAVDWLQANQGDLEKTLLSSGAGLVALFALTLLYLELVPRSGPNIGVMDLKGGSATLSSDAVAQRIEEAVARVPYVSDARVNVEGKRKGVTVGLDLNVDPQANLAQVTDEVCDVVRDVLANRVHVALLEAPSVRLHYREPRPARAPARRPVLNAAPTRNEPPELPAEERTPVLAGPRRSNGGQHEPDAHPFNGLAPAGTTSPPLSPRPVEEREVWAPEPLNRAEPLYTRSEPEIEETPGFTDAETDAQPPESDVEQPRRTDTPSREDERPRPGDAFPGASPV